MIKALFITLVALFILFAMSPVQAQDAHNQRHEEYKIEIFSEKIDRLPYVLDNLKRHAVGYHDAYLNLALVEALQIADYLKSNYKEPK